MNQVKLTLKSELVSADELEAALEAVRPAVMFALHSMTVESHITIEEEN